MTETTNSGTRTLYPTNKAAELAAMLNRTEKDGWEYIPVVVNTERRLAVVEIHDETGFCVGYF